MMKCEMCECKDTYVKEYEHTYCFKGKKIKFIAPRRFCSNCNSLVYDSELDNKASKKAIDLYNKEYGIPKEKIIELRRNYNLSQELFSKIIGCAKKTLISYEKGTSIPNDNYMIMINSLLKEPLMLKEIVEANKENYTSKEYDKIMSNISNIQYDNETFIPTEYNGYTKENKNKILNLILFFAEKGILKTKLLKEMFYVDFLNYKNTGSSITGLCYAKLKFGPVPDNFEKIINDFCSLNKINYVIYFTNEYENHNIKAKDKYDLSVFTDNEILTIKKVREFFKDYNSKDIVNFSHEEKAFTDTKFYEKISYDYAFDIERII